MKNEIQAGVYLPPEALKGNIYDSSGDIYSLAILIWELWQGESAFTNVREDNIEQFSARLDKPFYLLNNKGPRNDSISPQLATLLGHCMISNPVSRPNIKEIQDQWNYIDIHACHVNMPEVKETPQPAEVQVSLPGCDPAPKMFESSV